MPTNGNFVKILISRITSVEQRYIESDENLSLRGDKLKEAIKTDRCYHYINIIITTVSIMHLIREAGLVPFFLCATLGTTGACAFDSLEELGPICQVLIYAVVMV